jgi:hypothetical protein
MLLVCSLGMCYSRHDSVYMSLPPLQETEAEDELVALKPTHIYSAAADFFSVDGVSFTWPGVQLGAEATCMPTSMSEVLRLKVETGQLCCQLWFTARNATCST